MTCWNTVKLEEIATVSGASARNETNLPVYSVTKHRGFVPSLEYFNKQVFSRELGTYTVVEPGEFAYATIHLDEGSVGVCPERCLISPMYTAFRVTSAQVHPTFLIRYLKSPRALAEYPRLGKGSVERRRAISFERLGKIEIPLPPLAEQRRIAEVLDRAEALRVKRRAALAQLDTLSQSIFLDLFGDPVVNPKRWPNPTLGGLLSFQQYGPRFYNESYSDHGIRIVRITDLDDAGDLDFVEMPRLAVSDEDRDKYALRAGDLIFARSGATVGKVALIGPEDPPCIAGAYFITMRFAKTVEPAYARAVLVAPSIRAVVAKLSRQAAQQNFSGPGLRKLPMPLPPIELQRDFSRRLAAVEKLKAVYRASLAELTALFAALQHRAFRGEM